MTANPVKVPPDWLRHAVHGVLRQSPSYSQLQPEHRRALAQAMVKVSAIAAALIAEEGAAEAAIKATGSSSREVVAPARLPVLARAQEQPGFGTSADRIAGITGSVLNAVSFPRFVTDLINGVFKSMLDSNSQQMQMYVKLLNDVSASAEGFERSQFSIVQVRQWVADHFPDQIEYDLPETEPGDDPPDPEELANIRLRLKPDAGMPDAEQLRSTLGLGPDEGVDAGTPEQLVPLARRAIARQRQQMLATMVMLGMQRIVIDSGRINASMRFHIDTRSAANEDRSSQFGMQNRVKAAGSFGYGPWGASAEVENTISYVSTQRSQNTEEINTDLELNSSVELVFKTDYLPLERMAGGNQIERIKVNTLNPDLETKAVNDARAAREAANRTAEAGRSDVTRRAPDTAPTLSPSEPGGKGTIADADRRRAEAAHPANERASAKPAQSRAESGRTGTTADADRKATAAAPPANEHASAKPTARGAALALERDTDVRQPDVVFVPTPPESVSALLALAAPRPNEMLVDLGCGDGRIVVAAAQRYGCRCIGVDIDPQRIREARARIAAAKVDDKVQVEQCDLFTVDLSDADVVTVYLLPQLNVRLIPQLQKLRRGARIVSHDFPIAGVIPDRVVQEFLPELDLYKTYFLFVAPLRLQSTPVRHQWAESARLPWEASGALAI